MIPFVVAASVAAGVAHAQTSSPGPGSGPGSGPAPSSSPAPAASPDAARPESPGLLNELGKLLPSLKSPREVLDDLGARTREATDALPSVGLPSLGMPAVPSSVVRGRMACPTTSIGAPDCQTGAVKLCQANGYKDGTSIDMDSVRACSAMSMLGMRKPGEDACKTEYFVIRAVCQ